MSKNNEKQTTRQFQRFGDSSNQLTENEMLLIYGGDPNGIPASPGDDESG